MTPSIIPATEDHIPCIAEGIREADREELWALALLSPKDALVLSLKESAIAWTGLADQTPVCMFGVAAASTLSDTGRPWMLSSALVDRYAFAFLRRNKQKVQEMLQMFPYLENYIDCRNTRAIRWLKWLGFQFDTPTPYGVFGMPFFRFWMEA